MSDVYYKKKIPSCTLPDGTEWFAGAAGDSSILRVCTQVPIVAKNPTVTNSEYIERDRLLRDPYFQEDRYPESHLLRMAIMNQPAADVVPVVHGWWELKGQDVFCSVCGGESKYTWFGAHSFSIYCPNCGARMDGE